MFIAIDGGATTVMVAAFSDSKSTTPLGTTTFDVNPDADRRDFPSDVEWMARRDELFAEDWRKLLNACDRLTRLFGPAEAVGFAIAGTLNHDRTELINAGNMGHWALRPLAIPLSEYIGNRPVHLGNDAVAGGLAELLYGAGQGSKRMKYICWGSGVGGAVLVVTPSGEIVVINGEPGHVIVGPDSGASCNCDQPGCLESYCGGTKIKRRFGVEAKNLSSDQWEEIITLMAKAVYDAVVTAEVDAVVFGGSIAYHQPQVIMKIADKVSSRLTIVNPPTFAVTTFDSKQAGTLGALALTQV